MHPSQCRAGPAGEGDPRAGSWDPHRRWAVCVGRGVGGDQDEQELYGTCESIRCGSGSWGPMVSPGLHGAVPGGSCRSGRGCRARATVGTGLGGELFAESGLGLVGTWAGVQLGCHLHKLDPVPPSPARLPRGSSFLGPGGRFTRGDGSLSCAQRGQRWLPGCGAPHGPGGGAGQQ